MSKICKFTVNNKFNQAISALDNHLIISGKSTSTRRHYNRSLVSFITYSNKLPEDCNKTEIINIILNIQKERGFQSATLKHYLYAIKYYLKQIAERLDLFSKIPIPNCKVYDFNILNISEINLLINSAKNSRDKLIIQLLY